MELHELDLNLLVVFNQLLVERRVSKVAEHLGISQPGVSAHLRVLRESGFTTVRAAADALASGWAVGER